MTTVWLKKNGKSRTHKMTLSIFTIFFIAFFIFFGQCAKNFSIPDFAYCNLRTFTKKVFSLKANDLTYQGGRYEPSTPVNLKNSMS